MRPPAAARSISNAFYVFAAFALFAGLGCEPIPATETLLFFHAEPDVSARAASLRVEVLGEGINIEGFPRTDPISPDGTTLARLVLAPLARDADRTYEIVGQLFDEDGAFVGGVRVVSGYEREAQAELHVWFDLECVGLGMCGPGRTCVAGSCVGACFNATSEGAARSEPVCGECERCLRGECLAVDDGDACGCVGDTCAAGACEVGRAFDEIAVGDDVTCVVELGRLFCFGAETDGLSSGQPSEFAGFDGVLDVSIGSRHACAVDRSGVVHCWGWSGDGALGNGDMSERVIAEPQEVPALMASAVAAGGAHTCALDPEDGLRCFGVGSVGQLGDAVTGAQPNPGSPFLAGATDLMAGRAHTCALVDSELWCFGANESGQLGTGSAESQVTEPACMVERGEDECAQGIANASAGLSHSCVVFADGTVACAGQNDRGEVTPMEPTTRIDTLVRVILPETVSGAREVCVGQEHSCVLTSNGEVVCWGDNGDEQLGAEVRSDGFAQIDGTFVALGCGDQFSCALREDGAVICWGRADGGRLGDAALSGPSAPRRVCIE